MTLQVAPCQLSEVLLQLTQTFSHWWPGLMWQHCSLCFIRRWKKPKIPEYICKCLSSSVWLFHQVLHHAELLVFAMVLTLNVECGCEVVMPLGETLVCLSSLSWLFSTYMYTFIYIYVYALMLFQTESPSALLQQTWSHLQRSQTVCHQQFPICSPLPVFPHWYVNISELLLLGFNQKHLYLRWCGQHTDICDYIA